MSATVDDHDATLGEITRTLFSTLRELRVESGGPFVDVVRIASDNTTRDTPQLAGLPVVMFPPATEQYEVESFGTNGLGPGNTLVEHHRYFIGTATWRVYVVSRLIAGTEPDGSDVPGIEDLVDTVTKKLSGLFIPGLYLNERVVPLDAALVPAAQGLFVYKLRFTTRRVISANDVDEGTVPFHAMQGAVDLDGLGVLINPVQSIP